MAFADPTSPTACETSTAVFVREEREMLRSQMSSYSGLPKK